MKDYDIEVQSNNIRISILGDYTITTSNDGNETVVLISKVAAGESPTSIMEEITDIADGKDPMSISDVVSPLDTLEVKNVDEPTIKCTANKDSVKKLLDAGKTGMEIMIHTGFPADEVNSLIKEIRSSVKVKVLPGYDLDHDGNSSGYDIYVEMVENGLTIKEMSIKLNVGYSVLYSRLVCRELISRVNELKALKKEKSLIETIPNLKKPTPSKPRVKVKGKTISKKTVSSSADTQSKPISKKTNSTSSVNMSIMREKVRKMILDKMTRVAIRKELGINYRRFNILIEECGLTEALEINDREKECA